jgi:dihydrofolate synthase/folylpolyglutamate synthase
MPASRTEASTLTRASALAWLESRVNYERTLPTGPGGAESFGLLRMRQLLTAIGNPHTNQRVVHVAGTKGKGSTVALIAGILTAAGHRVGHYLSPHVHTLEERINIDGQSISPADLVRAFAEVMPAVDALDSSAERQGHRGPTWFEVVTAMAMVHFARAGVGIAVLETGLGGRLDATNVVSPLAAGVTQIGFDHMEFLGDTLQAIALEKAGIFKPATVAVVGDTLPAIRDVLLFPHMRKE